MATKPEPKGSKPYKKQQPPTGRRRKIYSKQRQDAMAGSVDSRPQTSFADKKRSQSIAQKIYSKLPNGQARYRQDKATQTAKSARAILKEKPTKTPTQLRAQNKKVMLDRELDARDNVVAKSGKDPGISNVDGQKVKMPRVVGERYQQLMTPMSKEWSTGNKPAKKKPQGGGFDKAPRLAPKTKVYKT